jgi:hypothetical protein
MSQTTEDSQKIIEALTEEKKKLAAEKAKLDAEKELLKAQRELAEAKAGPDAELERLRLAKEKAVLEKAQLDAAKALADAQKALAEAQKASDPALEALKTEAARATAEKAKLDAEKLLVDAEQALADAQNPELKSLERQKALADAQKAAAQAEQAALTAKYIGTVTAGPYEGKVDMKDTAGKTESALLAARATREAAMVIAKALPAAPKKIYLFETSEFPRFQQLLAFRFRKELLKQAFGSAGVEPGREAIPLAAPALVSAGLDAFSKILGFFKTDYTVGGFDVKLDKSVLLYAVAGALKSPGGGGKEVHMPLVYEPGAQNGAVSALAKELTELVNLRAAAGQKIKTLDTDADQLEQLVAEEQDENAKADLQRQVADARAMAEGVQGVVALFDSFASALTQPDADGAIPIETLALEFAIDLALQEGAVLLVRLEHTGGSFFIKKNLWTGLGAMPLYYMGGATVNYLLLEGKTGTVLAGNTVPLHGGFMKAGKIRSALENQE